ncbi:hypothetical protein H7I77_05970 [Mycolicibacterium novocastrense]|uniref:Uncharacterized protein n=1 Tax=Mycolicibacterium novocastrense TaxID=59813 RepID=A0AAW5SFN5_MYCNV|nr:hypothetical protein [Mycolicibacterium novocastrense]MCV7022898.1 hypothetical protein [Mycolicibacterium novocastrense]
MAAALAAGRGGMRSLRRCGGLVAAVAIAAASNAMTWPQSQTITPGPVGSQPVPRDHDSA